MIFPDDTVICVNASLHRDDETMLPLQVGQPYTVRNTRRCLCGAVFLDVGLPISKDFDIVCDCQRRVNDGIWWLDVKRFRKIEPSGAETIEITLTETVTRSVTIKIQR